MKQMKKPLCLVLAFIMVLSMLTACGETAEEEESFVLNVCVCDDIETLDPAMNTNSAAQSVLYALFDNLMRYTNDGSGGAQVSNGIAKEYTEDTNYDGTVTYRFSLRSSAHWSDGKSVTANDFVYAWKRLVDPATESPNHAVLDMVKGYDKVRETGNTDYLSVAAKNDTTFEVTLAKQCSYFIEGVCTAVATMPLREDWIEEHPDNWAGAGLITDGAYHIGTWMQGEFLQTKRNSEYYESQLVGPDAIRFTFASDRQKAYEMYQNQEIDCILDLPESAVEELSGQPNFQSVSLGKTYCVLYNNYTDVFSDRNVRAAFDLAINRASLADTAGMNAASAAGLVPNGIPNGDDKDDFRTVGGVLCPVDTEGYAERRDAALHSITMGGYYQGNAFPNLEFIYDGSDPTAMAVAQQLQKMWSEAIHVSVTPMALSSEELSRRLNSGEYDIAGTYLLASYDDAMSMLERFSSDSEDNIINYHNETYDILMGVADASDNLMARTAFLHDAEAMLLEDYALSPAFFGGTCGILRESLYGAYFDSVGRCYLSGVSKAES